MSADLPDQRYRTSNAMARVLVQYIACPKKVFNRIREDFDRPPSHRTIERYRAEYLKSLERVDDDPFRPHEGYYPRDVSKQAEEASNEFLRRLRAERRSSMPALNDRCQQARENAA